jgi:malonyl-CoA/methylmalonyl-CoA synthetase
MTQVSSHIGIWRLIAQRLAARAGEVVLATAQHSLTGGQVLAQVEAYAAALAAAGAKPGDRLAVQAPKSLELVLLYLAALRQGVVYLPLNNAYRSGEIDYFLSDARPVLFVCDPVDAEAHAPLAAAHGARLLTLDGDGAGTFADHVRAAHPSVEAYAPAPSDLASIIYTSGTTGRSKGAMITSANMEANAALLRDAWAIDEADVLLHALPLFHIHGLFVALSTALVAGATVVLQPSFDPNAVIAALPQATVFMGVPTFYTRLLSEPALDRDAARNIRLFVCGSAPLLPETFRAFEMRIGQKILERYGMSECGIICSNPLDGERVIGSVGPPLPGVQVRVADDNGKLLANGEVGVLEVRGPNVFAGYWQLPEKTAAEFRPGGWFITGDVSTIDEAGYVRIVGRAKDLVICGGLNVYPKEIEDLIDGFEGVEESAVIGVPHPDFGEAVAAVIKRRPGSAGPSEAQVIGQVKASLANFKVPKAVFFVDELPRNTMGKVQKAVLRAEHAGMFQG